MSREQRILRASEIGEYVFCHRAWWLDRIQGVEPANLLEMELGTARHTSHGEIVERAVMLRRFAQAFLAIAALFGAALALAALWSLH